MTHDQVLDVRTVPHAVRHQQIFEAFEALAPGDGFELVNDHEPKPLYHRFSTEHSGTFTWDYLENGPDLWRVRIGRSETPAANKGVTS